MHETVAPRIESFHPGWDFDLFHRPGDLLIREEISMTPENYVGNPVMAGLLKRKNELYAEMVSELKSMSQYLANKDLSAIKSGSGFHLIINGLLKKAQELEEDINDRR